MMIDMEQEIINLHLNAGKICGQERTCGNKIGYSSEESANKAAIKMNKKQTTRHELEPYPCYFCNKWHIGRKMSREELEQYLGAQLNGRTPLLHGENNSSILLAPTMLSIENRRETGSNPWRLRG